MADVLISYASQDRERAGKLASALSARGWSIWWDRKIIAGQAFDNAIERELESAKSVVVLWSKHSIESEWVKNEASVAAERGVLVPAVIDEVKLPLEFRRKQTADLTGWRGDPLHGGLQSLCEGIAALMGSEAPHPPVDPSDLPSQGKSRWRLAMVGGSIVALSVTLYTAWSWQDSGRDPIDAENQPGAVGELAKLVAGNFYGEVISDSKGSSRSDISVTIDTIIAPGLINVAYWKAKTLGIHTSVGSSRLDLRQYKDHEVIFAWRTD